MDGGLDVERVEHELRELLSGYRLALEYAADLPWLGRSRMSAGRARWGTRFWTRVYVETHVRKQLRAIAECLRLRRMSAADAGERARLKSLGDELEEHTAPFFRWRRLAGLVSRLPPVAAAIPVVTAAAAWPLQGDVTVDAIRTALLVLVVTALLVWIVVVWPSIRLGFRVKRAILAGGVDLRRPFYNTGETVTWRGFAVPRYDREGQAAIGPKAFPATNLYAAENLVYRALDRRKPTEVPLDLLLSFPPYVFTAYSAFYVYAVADAIVRGTLGGASWSGLFFGGLLALFPFGIVDRARQTYREREH